MIYTITVNPALDLNIDCGSPLQPTTHRTEKERRHAGGKGIDVSRVVRNLGGTSVAMGFLGGFTGRSIEGMLLEEGLEIDFVRIAEETRTNVIINAPIGENAKRHDHRLNAKGPKVQPVESWELFNKIKALSTAAPERKPTHAAICGSLAREMKGTYYANIIRSFKELGAKVYLDTSGKAMKESLRYPPRPDVVKPNLDELDDLLDLRLSRSLAEQRRVGESKEGLLDRVCGEQPCGHVTNGSRKTMGNFWKLLLEEVGSFSSRYPGVSALLVTMGANGMLLARKDVVHHSVFVPPPHFVKISTVGAGDTALGALIWALEAGGSWEEALQYATAASACAVTKPGTEAPDREEVIEYLRHVNVHSHFKAVRADGAEAAFRADNQTPQRGAASSTSGLRRVLTPKRRSRGRH